VPASDDYVARPLTFYPPHTAPPLADCSTYTIAVNPPEEAVVPGDVNNKGTITFGVTLSAPLIAAKAIPTATVDKAGATCTVTPVVAPADGKFTVTCSNLARDLNIITIEAKADGEPGAATRRGRARHMVAEWVRAPAARGCLRAFLHVHA
jgi:hypothetical protein